LRSTHRSPFYTASCLSLLDPHCRFFSCPAPPTTYIYTLSLHDALPISAPHLDSKLGKRAACLFSQAFRERHQYSRRTIQQDDLRDRKSTRLNSSHGSISYAVFCLKKKKQ